MPKIIKRYRYTKLKTVTKISDTNYMDWKWRRKYIGFIGELFILQSEEKFPGQHYLYFTNHRLNWIIKEDSPRHPSAVLNILYRTLEKAECKNIRFHDLRHTFATTALANGTDVKTLSVMIGHISSETTLNIYTHITDNMQRSAANKIEQGFGRNEGRLSLEEQIPEQTAKTPVKPKFEPKQPKIRRPGTGCIFQISAKKWEGSYSPKLPNGKRKKFNIYADTREECEEKLAEMIAEMKAEIRAEKEKIKAQQSV